MEYLFHPEDTKDLLYRQTLRTYKGSSPWYVPPRFWEPNIMQNKKTFTIVRNPYSRAISEYYNNWGGYKGNDSDSPSVMNKWIQAMILHPKGIRYLPQHMYVYDGHQKIVDDVLRFENLTASFNEVMLREGFSVRLDEEPFHKRRRGTLLTVNDLNNQTIAMINDYASQDFEFFGYEKKLVVTNGSYTVIKYYIPIANNNKHPSDFYMNALRKDCLGNKADSFKIVGDLDYISSNVPTCRPYLAKKLTFANLKYGAAVSKLSPSCALKFGNPTTPDAFSKMVLIWLNKLNVLCDAENIDENHHIILSDAGLISAWGEKMAHQRTQQMKQQCPPGHLCYIPYPKFDSSRTWFGNRKCQVAPVLMGGILSINNIDARHTCNRIINAFEEAIVVVQETQCPCFDEEIILTYMQKSHPELFFAIVES